MATYTKSVKIVDLPMMDSFFDIITNNCFTLSILKIKKSK